MARLPPLRGQQGTPDQLFHPLATEHLATAVNRYVATACYSSLPRAGTGGPKALIACAPEEFHDLGARLLSDLLECDGWDVDFYGSSMPLRDLLEAIAQQKPTLVGLSAALVMHLGSTKRTIDTIRAELGDETPAIAVGGNAFRADPDLARGRRRPVRRRRGGGG